MTIKDKTTQLFQDRCRALRPILGKQADDIWTAYLYQDEEGREELEEQLNLLANVNLNTDVQNITPIFHPPIGKLAAGPMSFGRVYYNAKDHGEFGLTENDIMHHIGVFGATGTGKSNAAHLIASQVHKTGIPLWIFDFKRGWRELRSLPEFQGLLVFTVGRDDIAPVSFNPLIPPEGVDLHAWIKKISHAISHAFFLGQGVLYLLEVILVKLYEEFGVFSGKTAHYPTFRDVLQMLRNYPIKSGRESLWLSSALRAIHSLCIGQMDRVVNSQSSNTLKDLVGHALVFELDSLAYEDRIFFTEYTMLWLYEYYQAKQAREKLQHLMIIEEVHNIAGREGHEDPSSRAIIDILFRQSREYGLGLLIIDQMPSAISKTALANIHCLIATGVKERADAVALAGSMLLDEDQRDTLGRLPLGTAIARVQRKGVSEAFMLRLPLVPLQKGSTGDDLVRTFMTPFIRLPEQLAEAVKDPSFKLTESEMAFLEDVALLPDSGVVARYTRLKLSGRQGNNVKRSLLELGCVEEIEKLTPKGRKIVLRLTEKGRKKLDSSYGTGLPV